MLPLYPQIRQRVSLYIGLALLTLFLSPVNAQNLGTGITARLGTANLGGLTLRNDDDPELDRSGVAVGIDVVHYRLPSRIGVSTLVGVGVDYAGWRRTESVTFDGFFDPRTNTFQQTVMTEGFRARMLSGSLFFGVGWSNRILMVNARIGATYLAAVRIRGQELRIDAAGEERFDDEIYAAGLNETVNGRDGRYRIAMEDRVGYDVGAEVLFRVRPRLNVGFAYKYLGFSRQPVLETGDPCSGRTCPPLDSTNQFGRSNTLWVDRGQLQLAVYYSIMEGL